MPPGFYVLAVAAIPRHRDTPHLDRDFGHPGPSSAVVPGIANPC